MGLTWAPSAEQTAAANRYESAVRFQLDRMRTYETALQYLRFLNGLLRQRNKTVTIVPYTPDQIPDGQRGYEQCQSITHDVDPVDARPLGGQYIPPGHVSTDSRPTTGRGSNVLIYYDPFLFRAADSFRDPHAANPRSNCNPPHSPGFLREEVLFHELVHSCRGVQGHLRAQEWTRPPYERWVSIEEFLATLVTNIYLSNKGQTEFRIYAGGVLTPPENTSAGFIGNLTHLDLVRQLANEEPGLFQCLGSIPAATTPFNPIREYLAHPASLIDTNPAVRIMQRRIVGAAAGF